MVSLKFSLAFVLIIAINVMYAAAAAYAQPNGRNSTRQIFKYIISDGIQDFAVESW